MLKPSLYICTLRINWVGIYTETKGKIYFSQGCTKQKMCNRLEHIVRHEGFLRADSEITTVDMKAVYRIIRVIVDSPWKPYAESRTESEPSNRVKWKSIVSDKISEQITGKTGEMNASSSTPSPITDIFLTTYFEILQLSDPNCCFPAVFYSFFLVVRRYNPHVKYFIVAVVFLTVSSLCGFVEYVVLSLYSGCRS